MAGDSAVVDIVRVTNEYLKVKDIRDRLEKDFRPEQVLLEKDRAELARWEEKLAQDPRPENNTELIKEKHRYELTKIEIENKFHETAERMEKRKAADMKIVLSDIRGAVASIAAATGCKMVLRSPEYDRIWNEAGNAHDPDDEPKSAAEMVQRFRENPVVFFATGLDITDRVIAKLNLDYKK